MYISIFRTVSLTIFLAALCGVAEAGLDEWTADGPFGASISALAVDPQTPTTIYIGTGTGGIGSGIGVFKSTDGGEHWSVAADGLTDLTTLALAIDPRTPTTLYAATFSDGVFKSTDGGATWTDASEGLFDFDRAPKTSPPSPDVVALAIDPQNPSTLYAGRIGYGAFKSTDGGGTWSDANGGLEFDGFTTSVTALAIDPQTPTTLYAATFYGVYKSDDGGGAWNTVNDGLTDFPSTLAIDPQTPTTLYAGTNSGLFKSIDSGGSWSAVAGGLLENQILSLAIDPQTPTTVYAGTIPSLGHGVFKSTDGGASWAAAAAGLPPTLTRILAIDPQTPSTIYAGTASGGVLKSTDGGGQWNARNDGIVATRIFSLAIDPLTPTTLYAGTFANVHRSTDSSASWNTVGNGLPDDGVQALAIDPLTPTTLYIGTLGSGVFKSTDGGNQWNAMNEGLFDLVVFSLAVDPQDPDILYAGTNNGTFGIGAFRSIDGGATWEVANVGLPPSTRVGSWAIDPLTPTTLYAGTFGGVFKSTDRGATWIPANDGLTAHLDDASVNALAIDPLNPATLYAGLSGGFGLGGVYRSTDGGASWSSVNSGALNDFSDVWTLAIDPLTPTTLYAGGIGDSSVGGTGGVYRTADGGANWTVVDEGLFPRAVSALAIDPATPSTLYAGTVGGGVFENRMVADQTVLALQGGRFKVEVDWRDYQGVPGPGTVAVVPTETDEGAVLSSQDSAVSQFFSPANWEMLVKIVDGRSLNDHFWVFLAAASDVELTTTVTDTSCDQVRTYLNPLGFAAPAVTDTTAFSDCPTPLPPSCVADGTTLCLGADGRFQVDIAWRDFAGDPGTGKQVSIPRAGLAKSDDSGLFYFFAPDNWELLIKVIDGCGFNDHFWVFAAATTDVEYTLTVTDTDTDQVKIYTNPLGQAADAVTDTSAFATCP